MAFFGVTLETIDKIKPVPNSDRLDVCTLEGLGFEFVVGRGEWKSGDQCLYFPLDSILPEALAEKLGVKGKLSGKAKNRIKTIRLRGQVSQGLIGRTNLIANLAATESTNFQITPELITKALGVTKYEPLEPGNIGVNGTHVRTMTLPLGQVMYDIEGAERHANAVLQLCCGNVCITEKLEGSNWSATATPEDRDYFNISVNSRRQSIQIEEDDPKSQHSFWTAYRKQGLDKLLDKLLTKYWFKHSLDAHSQIIIYGEICGPGIQGNIYKLLQPKVFLFDIKIGNRFLAPAEFYQTIKGYDHAPILAYDVDLPWIINNEVPEDWDSETQGKFGLKHIADGESMLQRRPREGIVIRPMIEQYSPQLNSRLIIKQRGPLYLAGEKD